MSGENGILVITLPDKEIVIAPLVDGVSSNQQPKAIHFTRYEDDPNHHIEIYNNEPMEDAIDLYAPNGEISISSSYLSINSTREDSNSQYAVNLHSENGGINLVAKKKNHSLM